jgi:chromosome segregation and condensation protein ScpB
VSSSFILRNLLIRGLINREENPNDKRSFLYKPTFDLFSYLGIQKMTDLPEYEAVRNEIIERRQKAEEVLKEST